MSYKIQPIRTQESRCIFVSIPPNFPIDHCNSSVSHATFPSCVEISASFFQQLFEPFEPCQSQIFHSAPILRSKTIICNLVMNYN